MLKIAFRNIILHRSKFTVVFLSLVISFAMILVTKSVLSGFDEVVKSKAARYFAGDVTLSFNPQNLDQSRLKTYEEMIGLVDKALEGSPFANRVIFVPRLNYDNNENHPKLFFNGKPVIQRRLVGLDWTNSANSFDKLEFVSGSVEGMKQPGGVLVSEAVAVQLGLSLGDTVVTEVTTIHGGINNLRAEVRGIFKETSIFSYASYFSLEDLNKSLLLHPHVITDLGLSDTLGDHAGLKKYLRNKLGQSINLLDEVRDKKEKLIQSKSTGDVDSWSLYDVYFYLADLGDLLVALFAATIFIVLIMLTIVVIGVSNTFSVINMERIKEFGTFRALGMYRSTLCGVVLYEASILWIIGLVFGLMIYGLLTLVLTQLLDFHGLQSASFLFEKGKIVPKLDFAEYVLFAGLFLVTVGVGALGPSYRAITMPPVKSLQTDK